MKKIEEYSLYPSPDRILVRIVEPHKEKGLIEIPGPLKSDMPQFGEVLAIGVKVLDNIPDHTPEAGRIRVGKIVGFSRHTVGMSKIVIGDDTFFPVSLGEINLILTAKPEEVIDQQPV